MAWEESGPPWASPAAAAPGVGPSACLFSGEAGLVSITLRLKPLFLRATWDLREVLGKMGEASCGLGGLRRDVCCGP